MQFVLLHLRERYDVVHNHGDSAILLLLIKRVLFLKVPVVTSVHIVRKAQYETIQKADIYGAAREGLDKEAYGSLPGLTASYRVLLMEKAYIELSDALAVVSEGLRREVVDAYGVSGDVDVILNGVNTGSFCNGDDEAENSWHSGARILFVGVLNGRKGEFDLIRAMKKVTAACPGASLSVIGDGPARGGATEMAERLGLEGNIRFMPCAGYADMPGHYRKSSLFVLPSYSEGLPKVLLEAMACGTPVVVSDIPGHREVVTDGVTGYLFKPGDVDGLAATIIKALENAEQGRMIASAARALVELRFTWDEVARRLDRVYERALEARG